MPKPLLLIDVDGRHCTIGECAKPLVARGMCGMHYRRWRLYGDPQHVQVIRGDAEAAFWSHVARDAEDKCWIWTAATNDQGYGKFQVGGKTWAAHVWAYTHFVGPIPDGMQIDHVKSAGCRHRNCVNFRSHLEPVTAAENVLRSDGPAALNARKTHCKRGHEFSVENTEWRGPGKRLRNCKTCRRVASRIDSAKRRNREAISSR